MVAGMVDTAAGRVGMAVHRVAGMVAGMADRVAGGSCCSCRLCKVDMGMDEADSHISRL